MPIAAMSGNEACYILCSSVPAGTQAEYYTSRPCQCAVQELILFSRADLERSIPSMLDGLKPGQRKILFGCFKRNLSKDIKVECNVTHVHVQ